MLSHIKTPSHEGVVDLLSGMQELRTTDTDQVVIRQRRLHENHRELSKLFCGLVWKTEDSQINYRELPSPSAWLICFNGV